MARRHTGPRWGTPGRRRAFGDTIRRARNDKGHSQVWLAAAVEVSPAYISQVETGQRIPSGNLCAAIAKVLDVDPRDLIIDAWKMNAPDGEIAEMIESWRWSGREREPEVVRRHPKLRLVIQRLAALPPLIQEDLVRVFIADLVYFGWRQRQLARVQKEAKRHARG